MVRWLTPEMNFQRVVAVFVYIVCVVDVSGESDEQREVKWKDG